MASNPAFSSLFPHSLSIVAHERRNSHCHEVIGIVDVTKYSSEMKAAGKHQSSALTCQLAAMIIIYAYEGEDSLPSDWH
jgi:hypothetical protein